MIMRPIDRIVLIIVGALMCSAFLVGCTGIAAAAISHH